MDRNFVKTVVIETVTEIQSLSGRSSAGIGGGTRPIGGLDGFDSLNAVEASFSFSEKLGCEVTSDVSLFAANGRAYTIDEITDNLCEHISAQE